MARRPQIELRVPGTRGHLFFFRKMVHHPRQAVEAGSLVDVMDNRGGFAGTGFYNPNSEIAIRLLTTTATDGDTFIEDRLRAAAAHRHDLLRLPDTTDAYRLCHAEGDGLTGLVVDRFGPVVVAQLFSLGWYRRLDAVRAALLAVLPGSTIHVTADDKSEDHEGFQLAEVKPPATVTVTENGAKFRVNFATGHKTGFFCDQRDNRKFVAELAKGRTMLDLCCYSGGFSIQAARAGATRVTSVDLDEEALATAKANAKLNGVSLELVHADLFDWLRKAPRPTPFDVIVLDPPKMARNRLEIGKARRAYFDMNRMAMEAAKPGAVLVTCSCSGLISELEFTDVLREAARAASREFRVFRISGAGADHPVSSLYPEGRYLKVVAGTVH